MTPSYTKSDQTGRKKTKTVKQLESELWKVFSQYIRLRDSNNGYFKCPTCGKIKPIDQADAGHFISRRWKSVKFDERNVHAQCRHCNRFNQGEQLEFYKFIRDKFGQDVVNELEVKRDFEKRSPFKYRDFELISLIDHYKKQIRG